MDNSTNPMLEFCENTQEYRLTDLIYPKYILIFRDGGYQTYEQLVNEPKIGSDGTMFVEALKMYQKVPDVSDNSNQTMALKKGETSRNETKNDVSHQENACNILKDEKCLKLPALCDVQLEGSSSLHLLNDKDCNAAYVKSRNSVVDKNDDPILLDLNIHPQNIKSLNNLDTDGISQVSTTHVSFNQAAVNLNNKNSDCTINIENQKIRNSQYENQCTNTLGIKIHSILGSLKKLPKQNIIKRKSANLRVCRLKCLLKINQNHILNLCDKFGALNAGNRKLYLSRLINKCLLPKNDQGKQKIIYSYNIPFKNRLIKVCKSCFKKIFILDSDFLKIH